MGKIVFAAAMSHVLDPDYYQAACGLSGRRKVEACMAEIGKLGDTLLAHRPDALIVVADDHAFLSPVMTMHRARPVTPLVPIWINCFVAPQPTPARCFAFGQHLARVVARSPWNVGIIATGGLSHFPELLLPRVGESDVVFDQKLLRWLTEGEHEPLRSLTPGELDKAGEHEFLNWMVLIGAVTPARADVRYFGELPRINLAAVEWRMR